MPVQGAIETLPDILRVTGRRCTHKVALQEWNGAGLRDTTYGELSAEVGGFCRMLRERGLRARDRVAILMPNGKPWVVSYLGIIELGAIAVPLEHEFLEGGQEHLRHALGQAAVRLAVVAPQDAGRVRALTRAEVLVFDGRVAGTRPLNDEAPPDVSPADVAQILYTSGTTGRKKGVMLTHANVLFNVRACIKRFGVRQDDCLPALLPHHHAYPLTTTVVVPLFAGARMPIGDVRDRRIGDFLRAARPTVLVGVPRVFEALVAGVENAARRQGALDALRRGEAVSAAVKRWLGVNVGKILFRGLHKRLFGGTQLRFCISGGARLKRETALRYLRLGIPIMQGWGMTELSPVGAVQPYRGLRFWLTRHYERLAGSIGLPLEGTEINLVDVPAQNVYLDRDGRGEMVVRGPHVMAGYYRDPAATRQILSDAGLRTGDIARRDAGGNYFIVGRAKHVIVLPGGKKVFPEDDMAEELAACPSIEQAVVRAVTDAKGRETIGIIVKPRAEAIRERGVGTVGELYALLKDEITWALRDKPDYMRRFELCLTELRDGRFQDLVQTGMKEPCPLKNEFRFETSYSVNCERQDPLELREEQSGPATGPAQPGGAENE